MSVVVLGIALGMGGWADRRIGGWSLRAASVMAGPAQQQGKTNPARSPIRPVPEFAALAALLHERQGLDLTEPVGPDLPSPGLLHYQRFPSAVFEEHPDGTIYAGYSPSRSPEWYDVTRAEDLSGPRSQEIRAGRGRKTFGQLLESNTAESRWPASARAAVSRSST